RAPGAQGLVAISTKHGPPYDLLGSVAIRDGRVWIISTTWTPSADSSGALGEALITVLQRLTNTQNPKNAWRTADNCTVGVADGLSLGRDGTARMAEITCGRQTVHIGVSRTGGGPSQVSVSLDT